MTGICTLCERKRELTSWIVMYRGDGKGAVRVRVCGECKAMSDEASKSERSLADVVKSDDVPTKLGTGFEV
jgi:hypothetical protein